MKTTLNLLLLLIAIAFVGCSKDKGPSINFNDKVREITTNKQFVPKLQQFTPASYKCTNWRIDFYNEVEKVGEWDSYNKSILDNEKLFVYHFENMQLNVVSSQMNPSNPSDKPLMSTSYEWDDNGTLTIDNISYVVKMQNEKLYLYYDITDVLDKEKMLNVTVENTYGKSLANEAGVLGIGRIELTSVNGKTINTTDINSANQLMEKFIGRQMISNQIFNTIKVSDGPNTFYLADGADNDNHEINLSNNNMDLSSVTTERGKLLFEPFLKKQTFTFKGVALKINRISHEDGSGNGFLVYGTIEDNATEVSFYYNIKEVKEHWIIGPQDENNINSANQLMEKFIGRQMISNQIFNTIKVSDGPNTFYLADGADNDNHEINLSNNNMDLSSVTTERGKLLFEPFLKKQTFTFKGVALKINRISHEDGSGNGFLVYGTTEDNATEVSFYYNIKEVKEHWINGPQSGNTNTNTNTPVNDQQFVGVWSLYQIGGGTATNEPDAIRYEFKADHTIIEYNDVDNVERYGTWSYSDNVMSISFTKQKDITTGVTSLIALSFKRDLISVTSTNLVFAVQWKEFPFRMYYRKM